MELFLFCNKNFLNIHNFFSNNKTAKALYDNVIIFSFKFSQGVFTNLLIHFLQTHLLFKHETVDFSYNEQVYLCKNFHFKIFHFYMYFCPDNKVDLKISQGFQTYGNLNCLMLPLNQRIPCCETYLSIKDEGRVKANICIPRIFFRIALKFLFKVDKKSKKKTLIYRNPKISLNFKRIYLSFR